MNSPHTGKPMQRLFKPVSMEFKGDHFMISYLYYYCPDTDTDYTDELLDGINLGQVYVQYARKHNLPLDQVIPKP